MFYFFENDIAVIAAPRTKADVRSTVVNRSCTTVVLIRFTPQQANCRKTSNALLAILRPPLADRRSFGELLAALGKDPGVIFVVRTCTNK